MLILPLAAFVFMVLCVGAAIGYGLAALRGGGVESVFWLVLATALAIVGAVHQFKAGNRAGDGGMGDVLLGAVLLLLAAGAWAGFAIWCYA